MPRNGNTQLIDVFKTIIPIFGRPIDYSEMLHKLAGFVFWECVVLLYVLRTDAAFATYLDSSFLNFLPKEALPEEIRFINFPVLIISLFIAFIFYFFQMHNIIQRPFAIRKNFDTHHIFTIIANGVGFTVTPEIIDRFQKDRGRHMQNIFYRYASSTKSDTVVDKHNIIQALWLWSMFWAFEEAILIIFCFSILFVSFGLREAAVISVFVILILILIMLLMWPRLIGAAKSQIEQILSSPVSQSEVRTAIGAI